ncbi:hypothetical protein G9A89_000806 [Geosiphon pyriformis]|nr:hypothetical protein G9A89_000806 [Geosiphon pyriformis]
MAHEIHPYNEIPQRNRFLTTLSGIGNNSNNMIGAGIFSTPGLVLSSVNKRGRPERGLESIEPVSLNRFILSETVVKLRLTMLAISRYFLPCCCNKHIVLR